MTQLLLHTTKSEMNEQGLRCLTLCIFILVTSRDRALWIFHLVQVTGLMNPLLPCLQGPRRQVAVSTLALWQVLCRL